MKASELRIGNLIVNPHTKEICTVQAIKPKYKQRKNQSTGEYFYFLDVIEYEGMNVTLDLFAPIPLTEEWLLKFGFKKSIHIDQWKKRGFGFIDVSNPQCAFVHQLQNLYFALTGEELTPPKS